MFDNNLRVERDFTKEWKDSCCKCFNEYSPLIILPTLPSPKYFPNISCKI